MKKKIYTKEEYLALNDLEKLMFVLQRNNVSCEATLDMTGLRVRFWNYYFQFDGKGNALDDSFSKPFNEQLKEFDKELGFNL